jgi:hypothetical protein
MREDDGFWETEGQDETMKSLGQVCISMSLHFDGDSSVMENGQPFFTVHHSVAW